MLRLYDYLQFFTVSAWGPFNPILATKPSGWVLSTAIVPKADIELYRDDGLAALVGTPKQIEGIKNKYD